MKLDHSIHLHSIRNARELGGYITADGRRVKSGVLLRTAMLNGISDEDIRLLTKVYRLAHIVDFRMDMELSAAEDPPIDGAEYRHLNVIDLSSFPAQEDEDVGKLRTDRKSTLRNSFFLPLLNSAMIRLKKHIPISSAYCFLPIPTAPCFGIVRAARTERVSRRC